MRHVIRVMVPRDIRALFVSYVSQEIIQHGRQMGPGWRSGKVDDRQCQEMKQTFDAIYHFLHFYTQSHHEKHSHFQIIVSLGTEMKPPRIGT